MKGRAGRDRTRPGAPNTMGRTGGSGGVPTFDEIFSEAKRSVNEVDTQTAERELAERDDVALIDVREKNEWEEGHIPGAVHVPRGYLELRIEGRVPDKDRPVLLYCAGGVRSVLAARTLRDMG